MSDVAELARAEADRVEAEERELGAEEIGADGVSADERDEEPAAEPAEEPTKPAFEVDGKALERELKRHDKAMLATLGPEWSAMEPCGTCGGMGAVPPDFAPVPEMLEDPDVLVCEACNGFGQRVTPSLNPQYAAAPCTVCNSLGYRTKEAIDAEREQAAIMAEQAARDAEVLAGYHAPEALPYGGNGYPPAPPTPVWDHVAGAWRFPVADAGVGGGVT